MSNQKEKKEMWQAKNSLTKQGTQIDELFGEIDSLKNIIIEKEKQITNLTTELQAVKNGIKTINKTQITTITTPRNATGYIKFVRTHNVVTCYIDIQPTKTVSGYSSLDIYTVSKTGSYVPLEYSISTLNMEARTGYTIGAIGTDGVINIWAWGSNIGTTRHITGSIVYVAK